MFTLIAEITALVRTSASSAMDEYDRLTKAGVKPTLPALVTVVTAKTKGFDPKHSGKSVLTPSLRASLCGSLAHVGYNIAAINKGQPTL